MLNAFCRVAPSDRFKRRAIDRAGTFFRASDLSSRTCTDVHDRLFDAFFMRISMYERGSCSRKFAKRKAPRVAGLSLRGGRVASLEVQGAIICRGDSGAP